MGYFAVDSMMVASWRYLTNKNLMDIIKALYIIYKLFELVNQRLWRDRSFAQIIGPSEHNNVKISLSSPTYKVLSTMESIFQVITPFGKFD